MGVRWLTLKVVPSATGALASEALAVVCLGAALWAPPVPDGSSAPRHSPLRLPRVAEPSRTRDAKAAAALQDDRRRRGW